ncbi:hypothetical protein D9756_003601 [Leucocoprinus leucothites]|uniref:GST C-terminal domain-containing protein n=1 Tax=Leucocoprinus leucothites TaxID=201217 RepID=A0A8H5LJ30_9AGAR|nr:hypothetical protein D9756_003601 [Leucoagaricus leucothites]
MSTEISDDRAGGSRSTIAEVWRSPWTQIILISLICFCCPGMYNAIGGLGGSGQLDSTVAANATVALLAATAASALTVVPPIFDMFGPRTCLLLGGWCYPLYSGSLLCYNHTHNSAFVIASGAILGIGASFLWVAQGAIMVSYPLPDQKGRAIAMFWVIFNLGGGIGSFISFALNFHSKGGTVTDGTYAAFMVIMGESRLRGGRACLLTYHVFSTTIFIPAVGWLLSVLIAPPHKVIRQDGTLAGPPPAEKMGFSASFHREVKNFVTSMGNWRIILLIPAFFCANFFYSYQQNNVNGNVFTLRTRSLNGAMYWIAQMFGGLLIGFLLDLKWLTRPQRALLGYVFVFVTGFAIWGGGLAFQRWADKTGKKQWLDFSDTKTFIGPFWLYFFYGAFDAFWQSFCYWLMASLAPTPQAAAKFVGLYKTFQAAGGAVAWRINALHYPAITQLKINWALFGSALVIALPTVLAITPSPVIASVDGTFEENRGEEEPRKTQPQFSFQDDDGFIVYESRAICRYIATKWADRGAPLIPLKDVKAIALFEQAASVEVSNFDPYAVKAVFEKVFKPTRGWGQTNEVVFEEAVKALQPKLDVYETILSKSKYLAGDEPTLADFFHLPFGSALPATGVDFFTGRPNFTRWFHDITNWPSWIAVKDGVVSKASYD